MKQNAYIAGVGMTPFGNHIEIALKTLAGTAITMAIEDAGIDRGDIEAAYMANAVGGLIVGQAMIAGQVALRQLGIGKIPVMNIENACASASTAAFQAAAMITAGAYDVVIACGSEKLFHQDKQRTFAAFNGAVDVENPAGLKGLLADICRKTGVAAPDPEGAAKRSAFMDIYAVAARSHMQKYGSTARQFAAVSAKNSFHGALNPKAQYREQLSIADVLAARVIVDPLTLPMCSPIGDGAACVILMSARAIKKFGISNPVRILSSVLGSSWVQQESDPSLGTYCSSIAYDEAGIGPRDLSCVELHDASAPSEVMAYEYLGLCDAGKGGELVESGVTRLGGRLPVNTSGGLLRKGHPVGATGTAQLVELTLQLQGRAGNRQVEGARLGMAHNAGGSLGTDTAATVITILSAE
ncbi:MAG: thiolase family protein [Alphaproteobacteria bacterium]|nr:thiolase family protein [Alphaproteobacteria bacterium]